MKILIIEDEQHISNLLSATLSTYRYAVDAIEDGAVGLEMATQWSYDLILLDVLLPTLNGIEVCRRLRAQGCQTPILMLTVKDSNEDVIAGLDAGADDYVAKSCDSSQLLARVRALLRRGGNASSSPVLTWGSLCLDPALVQVTYNQKVIHLRAKEYSLLELFLRHPRHILSRSVIIDHLWSIEEPPVEGSVTNLIKDLRQRLKSACMVTDLIETVYGLGYRLKAASTEDRRIPDRSDTKMAREEQGIVSQPVLAEDSDDDWDVREQRGRAAIHKITERFRLSLEQRIAVLVAAQRALEAGKFSLQQQIAARTQAHKLAGGLGTFGSVKASKVAQAIESLLASQGSQETRLTNQFSQLLEELKQELAELLTNKECGATTK
ncbi:MAG: response regulator [Chroococcidiopsidaceae cyanobacterium CP_BM_RX_35]|nr:response regulator [Chroococcidiopsidaceae cyanobacterium CP_BM_RX_35]